MHPTKQQIINGEKLYHQYKFITEGIDKVVGEQGDNALQFEVFMKDAMLILLAIEKVTYTERINQIVPKLEQLKKQYAVEFEKESAEVNVQMEKVIENAKKYIGQEPLAISAKIADCIARTEEGAMDQERKNDIYFALKGHVNFFKTKLK